MATLQTKPPISSEYGGTSVQPPPKSMRVGARVTIMSDTQLDIDRKRAVIDPRRKCGLNVFRAPRIASQIRPAVTPREIAVETGLDVSDIS